jgi:fimbrial chaperone protein
MPVRHGLKAFGMAAAIMSGIGVAAATGSLQIGPTVTALVGQERTSTITIRYSDATPATIQIRAMDWTQKDGEDVHAPSRELIVSPPFVTLQPNDAQTIRLLISNVPSVKTERAFRLFIDEVPNAAIRPNTGVQTALRIVSPVFLAPSTESRPRMKWSAARSASGVVLTARNDGDTREHLTGMKISAGGQVVGEGPAFSGYVLARSSRSWTLPATVTGEAVVSGTGAFGPIDARVAITR